MSFRPFTSESYAQDDRPEAWRDVLSTVGLQPAAAGSFYDGHATASHRSAAGVALTRIAAGSQAIAPLPQPNEHLPIVLLSIEDGVVLRSGAGHRIVPAGHLLLLPRCGDWSVVFQRDMRAIVLAVSSDALHGRITGKLEIQRAARGRAGGFADVFSRMLDATARTLETLSDVEWSTVAQSLVDLLLTWLTGSRRRPRMPVTARLCTGSARPSSAGSTIPTFRPRASRRPRASPSAICKSCSKAQATTSPIMCASGGCSAPGPICPIRPKRITRSRKSPIATALSIPRISAARSASVSACRRANSASRRPNGPRSTAAARGSAAGRTMRWRSCVRTRPASPRSIRSFIRSSADDRQAVERHTHHHLAVDAARVHWGYFSRSLPPQIGDRLRRHDHHRDADPARLRRSRADDRRAMPAPKACSAGRKDSKNVDRRGAGPMDACVFGRGAGEGFGVHICTGPVAVKDAQPGDVLEVRILDMVPRPSRNPDYEGRVFGSSVAAWWGYHYNEFLAEPKPREVVTIYEIFADGDDAACARALFLSLGAADRSVRRRAQDLRLSRRARRARQRQAPPRRARRHPHSACVRISA